MNTYTFWIETDTGEQTYWHRLTKRQAQALYKTTTDNAPHNLKEWGWGASEELKCADLPLDAATTN